MSQLEIYYQYRDGANWKSSTSRVFANPLNLSVEGVTKMLEDCLFDDENFIAESVGLPTCYFEDEVGDGEFAHGLHEFLYIRETDASPNDDTDRTIDELIRQFAKHSLAGWEPVREIVLDDDLANEFSAFTSYVLSCSISIK